MSMTLKQYMDKLGVGYVLQPYETCPWSHYEADEGTTANADVAMNADADEVQVEIMYLYDEPEEGKPPVKLAMRMKIMPHTGDQWKVKEYKVYGEDFMGKSYDWEKNACDVFRRCVAEIKRGLIPDFDELMEQEFYKGEKGGKRGGKGGGKKSPNIKPEQMPGMSRGKM